MAQHVHLLKLSVGSESVEDIAHWQTHRSQQVADGKYYHVTRMWPKREAEVLAGGSIYWVVKGMILCRQEIESFREVIGQDGIRRCGLVLKPEIHRVAATPKKAFQGWRYLDPGDAPRDLPKGGAHEDPLPPDLSQALAEIGVF